MIMKIFAVRDAKVEAFLQPFFSPTMPAAMRSISEVVNDPQHTFAKHAADYSLYALGEYDDTSGVIVGHDPVLVSPLIEMIAK